MIILRNNERLMAEIDRIAEVAGYLWTKGWAERYGGNISVNLTTLLSEEEKAANREKLFGDLLTANVAEPETTIKDEKEEK